MGRSLNDGGIVLGNQPHLIVQLNSRRQRFSGFPLSSMRISSVANPCDFPFQSGSPRNVTVDRMALISSRLPPNWTVELPSLDPMNKIACAGTFPTNNLPESTDMVTMTPRPSISLSSRYKPSNFSSASSTATLYQSFINPPLLSHQYNAARKYQMYRIRNWCIENA